MSLLLGIVPAEVAAQEDELIPENTSFEFTLEPNRDGVPTQWSADIAPSADLDEFVVNVFVDGVLEFSELEPSSITVDMEPVVDDRTLRVEVRDTGAVLGCEVHGSVLQLQNVDVVRTPRETESGSVLDAAEWTVSAASAAEVANLAAIGTFGSTATDFRITQDATTAVRVGDGEVFATATELWNDLSIGSNASNETAGFGQRLVVNETTELTSTGGSIFISESDFAGRVGSVRLDVDVLLSPLSTLESGFTLRVNGQIHDSGLIDQDGSATFSVLVDEASWPRDATVTLDLALHDAGSSCDSERPFSGQMEVRAIPVGQPTLPLSVSDFPAALLEGSTAALFADQDVSEFDIAVVSSALQATSSKLIGFSDADAASGADVLIRRGSQGSVVVDQGQLVVTVDDETIELLQEDRFWVFTENSEVVETDIETVPESLAFVDVVAVGGDPSDASPYRVGSFALLALGVLAVLRLLWSNSRDTQKS